MGSSLLRLGWLVGLASCSVYHADMLGAGTGGSEVTVEIGTGGATDAGSDVDARSTGDSGGVSDGAALAQYNFETGFDGFAFTPKNNGMTGRIGQSFNVVYDGVASLQVDFTPLSASQTANVEANVSYGGAGKTLTFHVFVPGNLSIVQFGAFVTDRCAGLVQRSYDTSAMPPDAWSMLTVQVPGNACGKIGLLGLSISNDTSTAPGTFYLDAISISP
jgi:hypothetical protein